MNNSIKKKWFTPVVQVKEEIEFSSSQPDHGLSSSKRFKRSYSEQDFTLNRSKHDTHSPLKLVCTDFSSSNWIENFAPTWVSDLAIHPKKIEELQSWLINAEKNKKLCRNPMLLVTGPAGIGKTISIKLIAKELGYNISEWITPLDIDLPRYEKFNRGYNSELTYREGQAEKFHEFLFKASRYPPLFDAGRKQLVLVEDFPNIFIKSPEKFNEILSKFNGYGKSPLIFCVTDMRSKQLNISFTLFPENFRQQYNIAHITFNLISTTMMKKGLNRICSLMARPGYSKYYRQPSQEVIDSIMVSSQGDIRNAVLNLHFASLTNAPSIELSTNSSVSTTKTSKAKKTTRAGKLKTVGRDDTITLMHALGRVCNPKYDEKTLMLTRSPEELTDSFLSQPSNFISFIHANYVTHFERIEDVADAADSICIADGFLKEYRDDALANFGLNMAVRGVMVTNSAIASGWKPIRGPKRMIELNPIEEQFKLKLENPVANDHLALDYRTYVKIIKSLR